MAKRRIRSSNTKEDFLTFDKEVFDKGCGRIYSLLQKISFPGFLLAILELSVLNAGLNLNNFSAGVFYLLMFVTIVYIVPSVFVLPTAWFMKSWKQKLMRESYVEMRDKELTFHKVTRFEKTGAVRTTIHCSEIYNVEKKGRNYLVEGKTSESAKGLKGRGVKIPIAFKNMEKLENLAK